MSTLVLQPRISRVRLEIWVDIVVGVVVKVDVGVEVGVNVYVEVNVNVNVGVRIWVGVNEDVSFGVGDPGMMVIIGVADGMNGGVGERIAGRGEGETTGVLIDTEMSPKLHDPSKRAKTIDRNILLIRILQSR